MGYPAHKFLEEFNADDRQLTEIVRALRPRPSPADPEQATAARVEEAHRQGYEEGKAMAQVDAAAELEALRKAHEERIEHLRAAFSDDLTEKLTTELRRQIDAVHASISDRLAAALLPVMRHVLTEASVRELANDLHDILNETGAVTVELRGPHELIQQVIQRLVDIGSAAATEGPQLKCIADDIAELRVTANDTVIETRLMDWIERMTSAVK